VPHIALAVQVSAVTGTAGGGLAGAGGDERLSFRDTPRRHIGDIGRLGIAHFGAFEIFRNFFWKFSLYENFDSRPPVQTPRNDFGVSTSLGWKF
jgi:hypothetical protein